MEGRLAPSVAEDKDVISSNSQYNKYRELYQSVIKRYLEDTTIDCVSDREGQYNHEHGHQRHKEALKVVKDE